MNSLKPQIHAHAIAIQEEIQNLPLQDLSYNTFSDGDLRTSRIAALIRQRVEELDPPEIRNRILEEFEGSGPLIPLLCDPGVTEILVNRREEVWFEKGGQLHLHEDHFISDLTYQNFLVRLCEGAGTQYTVSEPAAQGFWEGWRIQLVGSEITRGGPALCLRRIPKSPWTLKKLEEAQWALPQQIELIRGLIQGKKNFLVVGSTGSGKTSVLGACLRETEANERSVILEDTWELPLPNPISLKLLTRQDPQNALRPIDLSELIRHALRLRPDRVVVGEIRGPEAKDLLMALSTGHQGSLGTLHASTPHQALLRLEMLVQLGAPHWSLQAIRTLIFLSLHYIIVTGRSPQGSRCLEGIYRLCSREEFGILIEEVEH